MHRHRAGDGVRGARICASDLSRDALALAAQNLAEHGLARRVRLFEGDLARPFLEQGLEARFDAVVCNPPYIAEREIAFLQPEVRDHDPRLALDGGPDGLRFIRRLLAEAPALLKPEGHLILEAAEGQAGRIRALAADSGGAAPFGRAQGRTGRWRMVGSAEDSAGIERVAILQMGRGLEIGKSGD